MVEGMDTMVVTLSGYHGSERMKLIELISLAGANYVGKMSRSTTHLICWKFEGGKYELAKKFRTLIVNHQWLEDCIKEGRRIPEPPYTLQSGQEVGFNIPNLAVAKETAGTLSENKRLLNRSSIHSYFKDVIDVESDGIENDDWDDDLLLDENVFPKPRNRESTQYRYKRKLVKETLGENRRANVDTRRAICEPQKPAVGGLQCEVSDYSRKCSIKQRRTEYDPSMGLDFPECSRRSRRLVKKNVERIITEVATIGAEQPSRTNADVNELSFSLSQSNDSNDLSTEIEASISGRVDTTFTVHGQSRDEASNINDLGPSNTNVHGNDLLNAKGRNVEEISSDVQNSKGDKLGRDQSTVDASVELSCVICWTEFCSDRGVLPCGHRFCFSCIQNWADHMRTNRKEPTCPLCKASFASFTRVDAAASLDQKIYSQTIPLASSSHDIFFVPEGRTHLLDDEINLPSVCCQCQNRDPEDLLIKCRMCQRCIHSYCLDPPLYPWTCIGCRDRRFLP